MADIVSGLFGIDTGAVNREAMAGEAARAAQFANLNPQQQGQYGMMLAGQMGGRAVSGLLGAEDPRLTQAKQMQQVKDYIAQNGIDINSPEGLTQAAQYAQSIGATQGAMFLGQQAITLRKQRAETGTAEENLQRGQKWREAVAQLGPDATEEDILRLAVQHGTPEAAISAMGAIQRSKETAAAKAAEKQMGTVTDVEGNPVGRFDNTGRFISISGVVTPAKDYQAAKSTHESLQDSIDNILDISKDDIKNAFGSVNLTAVPGAGLLPGTEKTITAQNKINAVQINNVLDGLSKMKGATSDAEMMWLKSNFPKFTDSPATAEAWMNRAVKYINKQLQRGEKQFGFDTKLGNPDLFSAGAQKNDAKKADWMKRAAAANPNATQQELSDYYDQNKK